MLLVSKKSKTCFGHYVGYSQQLTFFTGIQKQRKLLSYNFLLVQENLKAGFHASVNKKIPYFFHTWICSKQTKL